MTVSRLSLARPKIATFLDQCPEHVFTRSELAAFLRDYRHVWDLAKKTTADDLIEHLLKSAPLKQLDFPFPSRHETRYVWRSVPFLEVLLTLKRRAYFTHHTAARLHKLTTTSLHQIYLNAEQRPHAKSPNGLTQVGIDRAFSKAQRTTNNVVEMARNKIHLLNGMNTGELAVIDEKFTYEERTVRVRVTGIERTLIDLTVRPAYAGGATEVVRAFQEAKGRASIKQLAEILTKLGCVYPYHQAIGYYLERTEYPSSDIDLFRSMPMKFDFYLANRLSDTHFVSAWRLHVPKTI